MSEKKKIMDDFREEDSVIKKFLEQFKSEPLTEEEIAHSMSSEFDYLDD